MKNILFLLIVFLISAILTYANAQDPSDKLEGVFKSAAGEDLLVGPCRDNLETVKYSEDPSISLFRVNDELPKDCPTYQPICYKGFCITKESLNVINLKLIFKSASGE